MANVSDADRSSGKQPGKQSTPLARINLEEKQQYRHLNKFRGTKSTYQEDLYKNGRVANKELGNLFKGLAGIQLVV